ITRTIPLSVMVQRSICYSITRASTTAKAVKSVIAAALAGVGLLTLSLAAAYFVRCSANDIISCSEDMMRDSSTFFVIFLFSLRIAVFGTISVHSSREKSMKRKRPFSSQH
ncbi:Uncharacterized protein FWK35_00011182, partial [Aphis craccivora]